MRDRVKELEDELARTQAKVDELERQLEQARVYREAVEMAPLAILRVSASKGRYVFANEAFAKMMGHEREKLLELDPYEVWIGSAHPDDLEPERNAMGRVASGEVDSFRLEKRVVPVGGQARWVRMDAFAARDAQGRLDCLTAYFTDIHEQRALVQTREELEAQLREEQKLGAVGKLAGGVAHDFNNRLVVIMGYCELLKRELTGDSTLMPHADLILGSAKRAAELTRQLLAYSRRQVLRPKAFSLNAMAESMGNLVKSVLGDRIEIATVLGASREVMADPGQIEQVILNLALNARDAMPGGGRLVLETRDASLGHGEDAILPAGNYVVLVVSDTGTGIAEDAIPHIFEPFFTTKQIGQGTGLGLSMVEGIVRQSGGAVRVNSRVGRGTTFTIHLPQATAPATIEPPSVEAPPRSSRFETVLVCEDDEEVQKLLVAVLRLRAYLVLTANNGEQALEVARRHPNRIDLLVTDVAMPGLGGIELAVQLRKRDPGLKVLFMSGYTEDADRLSKLRAPGTRFLPKPFLPGDLTRAVAAMLEASR